MRGKGENKDIIYARERKLSKDIAIVWFEKRKDNEP